MPSATNLAQLGSETLRFCSGINKLTTADAVLDALHTVTSQHSPLNVLGAAILPLRSGDWSHAERGKTVFLHKSVPAEWWDEHIELSRMHPAPGLMLAQMSLAPFTLSEMMRMLEPLGVDRWPVELALKHGIRDCLNCPVGGRWVVAFWSRSVLCNILSEEARAIAFMGATFAAIRLQKLIEPKTERVGKGARITPRELSVLRLLSLGMPIKEAAKHLGLGEETVRSHLKKVEAKLGVHDRTFAVAQAIRQRLIP